MAYGMPTRSPALRNYLDQQKMTNPYQTGNTYGGVQGLQSFQQDRMPTPYQPQGGMPSMRGFNPMMPRTPQPGAPQASPLSGGDAQKYVDFDRSLYAGPDYKGRHEANEMLKGQYAQLLRDLNALPPVDYSGSAEVGDVFNAQRKRMEDRLAAQGFGGSGIQAGAEANLAGRQSAALGEYYRRALAEDTQRRWAAQQQFQNYARQVGLMGLQRNWQEQDDPGFFGDLMGVVGGVAGSLIPGIGNVVGGVLGGGGNKQQSFNTPNIGAYDPNQYGPVPMVDPYDPWAPGNGGY